MIKELVEHPLKIKNCTNLIVNRESLILYNQSKSTGGYKKVNENSLKNLEKKYTSDNLSKKRISLLKSKLNIWLDGLVTQNRLNNKNQIKNVNYPSFITLTLSKNQKHNDNHIKRHLLMRFLEILKKDYDVTCYFWIAETQKNNNIHFHIIIDKYIFHKAIRLIWNKLQQNHEYISKEKNNEQLQKIPSTEIKSVKDTLKSVNYLVAYLLKSQNSRKISGRKSGVSNSIVKMEKCVINLEIVNREELAQLLEQNEADIVLGSHFIWISLNSEFYLAFKQTQYYRAYIKHILDINQHTYIPT